MKANAKQVAFLLVETYGRHPILRLLASRMSRDVYVRPPYMQWYQNENRRIGRGGMRGMRERSVLSLDQRGNRLTDWKQAETFMAAVSRAVINPLSRLFIAQREREFLICVKIVPRNRM